MTATADRRPRPEGWGRYYRRHQGPLCPWGEMSQENLVTFLKKNHTEGKS